jgi:hypothetical protein
MRHRLPQLPQRAAAVQGHDHVGGAVVFPESMHLHQRWVIELRQQPGLVDERLQPEREGLGMGLR